MPPRVNPNRTVALCGIRSDAESDDIEKILKDEGLLPACLESSGIAKLMKEKTDTDTDAGRRLFFLNCKSDGRCQKGARRPRQKEIGCARDGQVWPRAAGSAQERPQECQLDRFR